MPQQIKYKTTDIPARHITLHGCEKEDDRIFVCSYVVVQYVFWIFWHLCEWCTVSETGRGGAAVKKVHLDYFLCGTLRTVCIHSPEYSAWFSVFAQVTWAELTCSSPVFEPGCLHQVCQCWSKGRAAILSWKFMSQGRNVNNCKCNT